MHGQPPGKRRWGGRWVRGHVGRDARFRAGGWRTCGPALDTQGAAKSAPVLSPDKVRTRQAGRATPALRPRAGPTFPARPSGTSPPPCGSSWRLPPASGASAHAPSGGAWTSCGTRGAGSQLAPPAPPPGNSTQHPGLVRTGRAGQDGRPGQVSKRLGAGGPEGSLDLGWAGLGKPRDQDQVGEAPGT